MSESYQWLIICLNHTNDDSDISAVIGMIQTYYQSLVWFRHISHWHDSDILSVIGMIQTYYQSLVWFRHIISHWYDSDIVWIIPITDSMSESYQSLIIYLNRTNHWYRHIINDWHDSDILSVIGMIQTYY
jgi:hypothetical protein